MRADFPHQALRDDGEQVRGHEIRRDAEAEQAVNRRNGVVRVQRAEDEMAGFRRLHGDFGGFGVADFADENDVRVLAQNRAQAARKGQSGARIHLHLIDAFKLVFNRVFNRDDILRAVFQGVQRGVQRGGFAAAGRAGDENPALRLAQRGAVDVQMLLRHPQLRQPAHGNGFVQNPNHHFFAEMRQERGDAQINLALKKIDADAPVLRLAMFGNIQPGDDLNARNQGQLQPFRNANPFAQQAVNAIPDVQMLGGRLEMNIAGAFFDAVGDNHVRQADDLAAFADFADFADINGLFRAEFMLDADGFVSRHILQHPAKIFVHVVMLAHHVAELAGRRDKRLDPHAGRKFETLNRLDIKRIFHRNIQNFILHEQRKNVAPGGKMFRGKLHDILTNHGVIDIHIGDVDQFGDGAADFFFRHPAHFHEDLAD